MTAYRCIAADPPWSERGSGRIVRGAWGAYQRGEEWAPDRTARRLRRLPGMTCLPSSHRSTGAL